MIENIGFTKDIIFRNYFECDDDDDFINSLKCYSDSNIFYNIFNKDCDYSIQKICSSIKEKSNSVNIYPNPSTGTFNFSNQQEILNVQVFNIYGQQVQNCIREDKISLLDQPAGMYFVRMEFLNNEVVTRRLVKE